MDKGQGTDIHIASGQEKYLPHEAWHVVQQKQGRVRPTMQMKGKININDDASLEKEADVMGARAFQNTNNQSLPSLQRASDNNQREKFIQLRHNSDGIIQFGWWDEVVKPMFSGRHRYVNFTPVRNLTVEELDDPNPVMELAYQSLKKHAAPGAHEMKVSEEADGTDLSVTLLGTVNSVAESENLSLTNTTKEDHLLHPGTVHRQVVQEGDVIGIRSIGIGSGLFPLLNNWLTPIVWKPVDFEIRLDINENARAEFDAAREVAFMNDLQ